MANKPLPNSLPADLPEDWQYNQIVAPAGADVGLSAQHGYNYLMEQVNVVQEAVNQINNAFANLASLNTSGKIPIEQLVIDTALSATSNNPVQNKVVQAAIEVINTALGGKAASNHGHTLASLGAAAANHSHTAVQVGAAAANHTHTAAQVGAAASNHTHTAAALGISLQSLGGCRVVTGSYVGNDQELTVGAGGTIAGGQFVNLGATPKFVICHYAGGSNFCSPGALTQDTSTAVSTLTASNNTLQNSISQKVYMIIVQNGFYVGRLYNSRTAAYNGPNNSNTNYAYVAII